MSTACVSAEASSHCASSMRSGAAFMYAVFGQSARCTDTPLPIVT